MTVSCKAQPFFAGAGSVNINLAGFIFQVFTNFLTILLLQVKYMPIYDNYYNSMICHSHEVFLGMLHDSDFISSCFCILQNNDKNEITDLKYNVSSYGDTGCTGSLPEEL